MSPQVVVGRWVKVLSSHGVVAVTMTFSLQRQAWGHPGQPEGSWIPASECVLYLPWQVAPLLAVSLFRFTCKMGIAPIRELCTDFHFPILEWTNRTRLHEPTACEKKKECAHVFPWRSPVTQIFHWEGSPGVIPGSSLTHYVSILQIPYECSFTARAGLDSPVLDRWVMISSTTCCAFTAMQSLLWSLFQSWDTRSPGFLAGLALAVLLVFSMIHNRTRLHEPTACEEKKSWDTRSQCFTPACILLDQLI